MEVSNQKEKNPEEAVEEQQSQVPCRLKCYKEEPFGPELLDQVSFLTELPENAIEQELHEILDLAQLDRQEVTLEQLRESMLRYLDLVNDEVQQAIHADSLEYL
jgi:hypothetical protein